MSNVQDQVDYHAARALQELEWAGRTHLDSERYPHMELSRLHSNKAGRLLAKRPDVSAGAMYRKKAIDMGEASRVVDFHELGSR